MNQAKTCKNAMELLVDQEVSRQLAQLPEKLMKYINLSEVATYALNRLPPLYSYSEEGWRQQKLRGEKKLSQQIKKTVHQAFVMIAGDLFLHSMPAQQGQKPEDEQIKRKNTASAVPRRASSSLRVPVVNVNQPQNSPPLSASAVPRCASSSLRVPVVNVNQPQNLPLSENIDVWGNSFYLR